MKYVKLFEEFCALDESRKLHFTFEDERYTIRQSEEDPTLFGIRGKKVDWIASARGDEFNPWKHDMTGKQMLDSISRGIKHFTILGEVTKKDVEESEWRTLFPYALQHSELIDKEYVVLKLQCGKANAKYHIAQRERSDVKDDEPTTHKHKEHKEEKKVEDKPKEKKEEHGTDHETHSSF